MLKRIFDITLSLMAVIFIFPLMCLIWIVIKLDSPGPIFYRGIRTGQYGKPFRIFKFRTMVDNADRIGGPSTALNDDRLTRSGKFLRKYKFDELPQIFNVLMGDMSIVGPRPQVLQYTIRYSGPEKAILSVKPGMTDYASLEYINLDQILGDENVDDRYLKEIEPRKNQLRIEYVKQSSLSTDIKIILLTVKKLISIRKIWNTDS